MADRPIKAEELRALAEPLIAIPGFQPGETITVKVRRVSLFRLISEGVMPNPLLPVLHKTLAAEGRWNPLTGGSPEEFRAFTQAIEAVCRAMLVEPTYDEVGDLLTDEQRMAIFTFAQAGVVPLRSFRRQQGPRAKARGDGEGVPDEAE